jgi:hypothetical protein
MFRSMGKRFSVRSLSDRTSWLRGQEEVVSVLEDTHSRCAV